MEQGQWREARRIVREARHVVALTGAGISMMTSGLNTGI